MLECTTVILVQGAVGFLLTVGQQPSVDSSP